ncbi:MAG: rod shape-determining protein MreD [Lactobacillales bacterium]|jgi:rod shape-determining protein MreD|nr:rod shape-determining protein MreD [Lactobacillales bacterium]
MNPKSLKIYAPILFFALLLIDSHLTNLLEIWTKDNYYPIVNLLIMAFMVATVHLSRRYLMISALVIGLIFDSYYLGILGINLVVLPLIVYWMTRYKELINTNVITQFFTMIIVVTAYEVFTTLLQAIFQLASVDFITFITQLLGPTLLINMVCFLLIIYPLRKLFSIK